MRSRLTAFRALCLIALAASGAGLAEALFDAHEFCGFGTGCDEVAASVYARPLGVPLPAVGVAGFGLVLGLSLVPGSRPFALLRPLAWAAGAVGLALVVVQLLVLGRVCQLCLVADLCGVGLAAIALAGRFVPPEVSWRRRAAWLGAAGLIVGAPVFLDWAATDPPPPEPVVAHRVPGKITVVEVTDFDCPHCRGADPVLREVIRERNGLHFVRLVAPMPRHPNARPAGRAYLAAGRQGKGEEMAAALFATEDRTPQGCRRLAGSLGLDLGAYDRVVADPGTDAEMDATVAWARTAGPGLPLIWVQDKLIHGMPTPDALRDAFRRAERR
ncbi:MAG: hypothetical protein JWO38_32 [Gemmataceae bacterium]|nr:hypothetical protein [Gemmataceae bacterium]